MNRGEAVASDQYKVNQAKWKWLVWAENPKSAPANWDINGMHRSQTEQKGRFGDLLISQSLDARAEVLH